MKRVYQRMVATSFFSDPLYRLTIFGLGAINRTGIVIPDLVPLARKQS